MSVKNEKRLCFKQQSLFSGRIWIKETGAFTEIRTAGGQKKK